MCRGKLFGARRGYRVGLATNGWGGGDQRSADVAATDRPCAVIEDYEAGGLAGAGEAEGAHASSPNIVVCGSGGASRSYDHPRGWSPFRNTSTF